MTRQQREAIIWFAAFFNGEGSIGIYEFLQQGYKDRTYRTYKRALTLTNTDQSIMLEAQQLFGGTLSQNRPGNNKLIKNEICFHLVWDGRKAEKIARMFFPYLKGKKKEQCGVFLEAMHQWPNERGEGKGGRLTDATIQLRNNLANSVNKYNAQSTRRAKYSTLSQAAETVNEVNEAEGATTIDEARKGKDSLAC